jgi:hypothetical protein
MWIGDGTLKDAKIRPDAKNERIAQIWGDIKTYEASRNTGGTLHEMAHVIQRLMVNVGGWVTSKQPHESKPGMQTNTSRWNAMRVIAEKVGIEAGRLGIKTLTAPADPKEIKGDFKNQSYWLELLDPKHRPGFDLSSSFEDWYNNTNARENKQSFWAYLDGQNEPVSTTNVAYLNEFEAEKYKVKFQGNKLVNSDDAEVSTQNNETVVSGKGWAIFVVDLDGNLYLGSHILGVFHHSSFLSGKPVLAAGEILVDNGIIKVVTCKSGHYRPSFNEMKTFARLFPQCHGTAIIRPSFDSHNYYRMSDFKDAADENSLSNKVLAREDVQQYMWPWDSAKILSIPTRGEIAASRAPQPPASVNVAPLPGGYANAPYSGGTGYANEGRRGYANEGRTNPAISITRYK